MLSAIDKRKIFREVLRGAACVLPASVYDALSMRAAQDLGFEMAMLGGSIASLTVLGAPDIAVLTLSELVDQVRRICRTGDVPLLVDGDHGYGNALNVRRMIAELEAAGAAGVTVEDTVLPASFAGEGPPLISVRELGAKLRAALDARTDPDFVIVGRTNASLVADRAELLERQAAMQEAGADAVFVTGVKALQDVDALSAGARVPLVLGSAPSGATHAQLAERNVRVCLAGHQGFFEGVAAVYRYLRQQRAASVPGEVEPKALVSRLSDAEQYARWAGQFLK